MPRPAIPTLTPFAGQLPDINNPATWASLTPPLWTWWTGAGYVNQTALRTYSEAAMTYIDGALAGSATVVDAVANLNNGTTPAGRATKLVNARTVTLQGDVTGSFAFDGSQNVVLNVTVKGDSHDHDAARITSGQFNPLRMPDLLQKALNVNGNVLNNIGRLDFGGGGDYLRWFTAIGLVGYENSVEQFRIGSQNTFQQTVRTQADLQADGNLRIGQDITNAPGVGNVTEGAAIQPNGSGTFSRRDQAAIFANRVFSDGPAIALFKGGSSVGSIVVTAVGASYNSNSDYRLKENVREIDDAVARVMAYRPCYFNFKSDPEITVSGFLAHEVASVNPVAVTGEKDAMRDEEYEVSPAVLDTEGNEVSPAVVGVRSVPDYQQFDPSKIIADLTAALQNALERIAALEIRDPLAQKDQ